MAFYTEKKVPAPGRRRLRPRPAAFLLLLVLVLAGGFLLYKAARHFGGRGKVYTVQEMTEGIDRAREGVKKLAESHVAGNVKEYGELVSGIRDDLVDRDLLVFTKDKEEKYDIMLEGVEKLRDFFGGLAKETTKGDVAEQMKEYADTIDTYLVQLPDRIQDEENVRKGFYQELDQAAQGKDAVSQELLAKSVSSRIELCEKRLIQLRAFQARVQRVREAMRKVENGMGRFDQAVEQGARLYGDLLQTMQMSKEGNTARMSLAETKTLELIGRDVALATVEMFETAGTSPRQVEGARKQ